MENLGELPTLLWVLQRGQGAASLLLRSKKGKPERSWTGTRQ